MVATIKTLAKETGLSLTTVSKYLNGGNVLSENKIAIEKAIKKYNYKLNYVAKTLKTGHTDTVGIVLPSFLDVYHTSLFHYVEVFLRKNGFSIQIFGSGDTLDAEKNAIQNLLARRVDAIFMLPVYGAKENANDIISRGVPLVIGDQFLEGVDADYVLFDNKKISSDAVRVLIEAGHKRIAVVGADRKYYTANQRYLGYLEAMAEANIEIIPEYQIFCSDFKTDESKDVVCQLLDLEEPPTAFFATNFYSTVGMISAFHERGLRMGEDISAVGYDSRFILDLVNPKLTIVEQPIEEAGRQISELICKKLRQENNDKKEQIIIPSKLIIGKSVGRI